MTVRYLYEQKPESNYSKIILEINRDRLKKNYQEKEETSFARLDEHRNKLKKQEAQNK